MATKTSHKKYDAARSMKSGFSALTYVKNNGELVTRVGTLVSASRKDKTNATSKRGILRYFDLTKGAWCSCKAENIVECKRVTM